MNWMIDMEIRQLVSSNGIQVRANPPEYEHYGYNILQFYFLFYYHIPGTGTGTGRG